MRHAHQLRVCESSSIPRAHFFFDTETTSRPGPYGESVHLLHLGWCCRVRLSDTKSKRSETWFQFDDAGAHWQWILAHLLSGRKNVVCAHNLIYDFAVTQGFRFLTADGWRLQSLAAKGLMLMMKWRKDKTTILCLDSGNFFREPLAAIGVKLGTPKLVCDVWSANDDDLSAYCHRDVEILRDAMLRFYDFVSDNDAGRLAVSVSGQAMNDFTHSRMQHAVMIHDREDVIRLERHAYKGGRCECLRVGVFDDGPYYKLDVNSMYPAVMRDEAFPVAVDRRYDNLSARGLQALVRSASVIAVVDVRTDEPVYGVKSNRGLIFPRGEFRTVLTTPELRYALDHKHIRHCVRAVSYRSRALFTAYVTYWYRKRLEYRKAGKRLEEEITKLMLNSLYGKFGQKLDVWEPVVGTPAPGDYIEEGFDSDSERYVTFRSIAGRFEKLMGETESFNAFPAIAAHVAAFARMRLWELRVLAGYGTVFYLDTDSLIVSQAGIDGLRGNMDDDELGKLKIEQIAARLDLRTPKDYAADDVRHLKGIKANAKEVSPGVYEQTIFPRLNMLLRRKEVNEYITIDMTKVVSGTYRKGIVDELGVVSPFRFGGRIDEDSGERHQVEIDDVLNSSPYESRPFL